MFQGYALFPHMTVQQNVEYGLMVKKVAKPDRRRRAADVLQMVRLGSHGSRKPSQLLGALDLKLRREMQVEPKGIQRAVGITFVYVTHDQKEALTMPDRMAVFDEGRIEQVGPPAEVYEHPQSEFIAVASSAILVSVIPVYLAARIAGGSGLNGRATAEGIVAAAVEAEP